MLTKRDFILHGSCLCEKYRYTEYDVLCVQICTDMYRYNDFTKELLLCSTMHKCYFESAL